MSACLTFEDYLPVAEALPSTPRVLPRLLGLLSDPDSEIGQIVDVICIDPGLTSKLLRACNSAFVGLPEPAGDVAEAVQRLGVSFIYNLAATACGGTLFQSATRPEAALRVWQLSVTSAFAADKLAADLGLNPGMLFTAALLQDVGKMVLAERWQEAYWVLLEESTASPAELIAKERETFGIDHGELGGRLLTHWKFPSPIASSVWRHHVPQPGTPFEHETACVAVSDAIAHTVMDSQRAGALTLSADQETALSLLRLTSDGLQPYLSRAQENFQFVNAMCQIGL